jgi:hypothetical protein
MPVIATAAPDWNEGHEHNPLAASLKKVVEMRFGPSTATRDVCYITDPRQLRSLLEIAASATTLAEIEAAIQSAVPPPK